MADQRTFAARQFRGHLSRERGRNFVPDEIDTAVHRMQALLSEAMVHGAGAHTYGKKLMTRDDSVLLGGHPRDRRIACCSYRQTALSFVRRTRGSSSPRSACKSSAGPCSRSASVRFACSAKGNTPYPARFRSLNAGGAQSCHTPARETIQAIKRSRIFVASSG
jgi:hypothetical protein